MSLFSSLTPTLLWLFERALKYAEAGELRVLSSASNTGKGKKKSTYAVIHASLAEKVLFRAWMKINKEKNRLQQSLQSAKMAHLGAGGDVRLAIKPSAPASIWAELIAARQAWEELIRTTQQERKVCTAYKKTKNEPDYSAISAVEPSILLLHWGPWRSCVPEAELPLGFFWFHFDWQGAGLRVRSHVGEKRI